MNSKKWVISLLSILLAAVVIFGAITYYLDPLLQYGDESGILTHREYTEIYCNPGIAKNYKYDTVFLGSSMVENANVSEIDELFGCKTIKVPYSGGSSYNHKTILDVCYASDNKINKVFWALDEYAFTTDKDTPRYPLPEYLYDDNKTNDLSYLLNLDVFYFYTMKDVLGTFRGQEQILMRDGSWNDESVYCKENALASSSYPIAKQESRGKEYYSKNLAENLTYNVLPFVEEHPETEFYFYMVPYSILYWYMSLQNGTLEAEIHIARTAISKLLEYPNVNIFFFQDEYDIITNLDNYKDYSHFAPFINSYMSNQMSQGNNKLTTENYDARLDEFYRYLTEFDYDTFYQSNIE